MKKLVISATLAGAVFISPMVGEAALGDQLLKKGMKHEDVRELQLELRETVSMESQIDGIFGPLTKQSVKEFQSKKGITVDGIVGPETFSAFNIHNSDSSTTVASSSNDLNASSVLREGSRGADVKSLQSALKDLGMYTSTLDGIYGPLTARAVRNFQQDANIQVDGIAGPQTFNSLNGEETSGATTASSNNSSTSQSASANVDQLVQDAKDLLGSSYVWGGTTPAGFDSSGFIVYVFNQNGINLSRTHREYYYEGESVSNLQRGDVVFFQTYLDAPSHAGIYLGNNEFIHNSSSQGVIITSMDNSYWSPKYIGAKRYTK
ncbi:peptidoglycan-binding protein [Salipaludibacillus daqingensis]|uniref:C40 family peptidase n=1 Tax=Salipaludibacillus daqingensis TaxID=3041001 RepID=UPI002472F73D|nr:peptidoglycan-binding protein [Salipaludibacillus daqingensis]